MLVGLTVSEWNLSLLWACKPVILEVRAFLGDQLSGQVLGLKGYGTALAVGADENRKSPVAGCPVAPMSCALPEVLF